MREGLEIKKEQVLIPEKRTYPWQILEADHESWVIFRWREKVSKRPIEQLGQVRLEDFEGKMSYEDGEKRYFSGAIAFTITYRVSPTGRKPYVVNEPWREESTCEEFFMKQAQSPLGGGRKREDEQKDNPQAEASVSSSFPSLLLSSEDLRRWEESEDKDESEHEHEHEDEEKKVWLVQSPWRCWFRGNYAAGGIPVPECVKVHVAQVGLYTLLLEAVIKLEPQSGEDMEKQAGDGMEKQGADQHREIKQEFTHKYLLRLQDSPPAEVLGVAVERAFPRISYQLKEKMLGESFLQKLSLLYIKAREGGERFTIASNITEQKLLFAGFSEPVYPLVQSKRVKSAVVPVGAQSWYYWETEVYSLATELPEKQAPEEIKAVNAVVGATVYALPKRGRPGERWLKKGEGRGAEKTKTLITIKI